MALVGVGRWVAVMAGIWAVAVARGGEVGVTVHVGGRVTPRFKSAMITGFGPKSPAAVTGC